MSARTKAAKLFAPQGSVRRYDVPGYVAKQYGSARWFKQTKRTKLRAIRVAFRDFYMGCAFFHGGSTIAQRIRDDLQTLALDLSVKSWGR